MFTYDFPSRGHRCKKEIIYGQGPEENLRFGAVTNATKKSPPNDNAVFSGKSYT